MIFPGPDENWVLCKGLRRRQFSMTAAYAFTEYRSQEQILACVIISDIRSPPTRCTQSLQSVCRAFQEQWKGGYQAVTRSDTAVRVSS